MTHAEMNEFIAKTNAVAACFTDKGDFIALDRAKKLLSQAGFRQIAPDGSDHRTCVTYGANAEKSEVHGIINGDHRRGPIIIVLSHGCPHEGVEAFLSAARLPTEDEPSTEGLGKIMPENGIGALE